MKEEIVTHFKILEKLGAGGMGEVYKAVDLKLSRPVALKFLSSSYSFDSEQRARLLNEAEAASALDHKNICTVYEVDETEDNQIFIAMAYYEGETLKEKLRKGNIELNQAIEIIIQIAEGLFSAHEKSIIHRDIKPDNIFITTDGEVKILDFGIAKIQNQTQITRFKSTPGTTAYMSPEQIKDEYVDYSTDIWSLGVVFYEMLTGQKPFTGESDPAMIYSILNEEPSALENYYKKFPPNLQQIINKLLSKEKHQRYSSLYELIKDLKLLLGEKLTLKKKISLKKKKIRIYFISIISVITIILLAFVLSNSLVNNSSTLQEKIPIAVIPFENQTGDTTYNYLSKVIPNLLITSLEQTNYFNILTLEELHDIAKQTIESKNNLTKNTWLEICKKGNADMVVSGSYTKAGDKFLNDIKILKVRSNKLLTSFKTIGDGSESLLLGQVDEMTKEISRELGVLKLDDLKKLKPISDVTTTSLEAYNYYLKGKEEFDNLNFEKSKDLLEKVVEIDSSFAVAYAYLGIDYSYLQNTKKMNIAMQKAIKFSNEVSSKERGIIEAQYAILVKSDLNEFVRIYENLEKQYPNEKWFHICLGFGYSRQGRYKNAIFQKEKILEKDPDHHSTLNSLAYLYIELKDFNKARTYFNRLVKAYPNDPNGFDSMGDLFLIQGDLETSFTYYNKAYELSNAFGSQIKIAYLFALHQNFDEAIRWIDKHVLSAPTDGAKSIAYCWKAFYHFLISDYEVASADFNEAVKFAANVNEEILLSNIYYIRAWLELDRKNYDAAEYYINKWIKIRKNSSEQIAANIEIDYLLFNSYLKLASDSMTIECKEIKSKIEQVQNISVFDSLHFNNIFNMLYATGLYKQGEFKNAIKVNRSIYFHEMTQNSRLIKYNLPVQIDIKAQCYEKLGDIDHAINEYKRIAYFDPEMSERRIINPVYHYRLGKLYEQKGLMDNAIKEYKMFLDIHKNNSTSNPDLEDVKVRLQKLLQI